jgi:undecaprenyl-diphosphatase
LNIALWIKAALMGIVEGLTEFLPISSTGHLILSASILDFTGPSVKVFTIVIQSGAILAVVWQYRSRVASTFQGLTSQPIAQRFARNLLIAFMPTMLVGALFYKAIKEKLFHPVPVAIAFIVGGVIILWVERVYSQRTTQLESTKHLSHRIETVDDMGLFDAFKVGLLQCLGMIPGMSRSGSTIIGSLFFGFSRQAATEFSFYLGIPALLGAGVFSIIKNRALLHWSDLPTLLIGTVFSFVFALLCIRWLIRYVPTHNFVVFAWYRIVFGLIVLLTAWQGWVVWADA